MFEEGERYRKIGQVETDIFVVGIDKQTDTETIMAIFYVNQHTGSMLSSDEITIKKEDYSKWQKIEET
jgi:uncharacterized protein YrzB (UPF0473 family)